MNQGISWQFGLILAYLIPGFVGLGGVASILPAVARWLAPSGLDVGSTFYALLAATAVGMTLSCFRWLLIDHLHAVTGISRPRWDDAALQSNLVGFDYLVQNHFRYYEFCGNMILALSWAYAINRALATSRFFDLRTDVAVFVVLCVLFTASRDALAKYYNRTALLLGELVNEDR